MTTIPPEPIPNYQEAADHLIAEIRRLLIEHVPGFGYATTARRRKINPTAAVPDAFLEAVAVACATSPGLEAGSPMTGAEIRAAIPFSFAFSSVGSEMDLFGKGARDAVALHRYDAGEAALAIYHRAKRINRPEDREMLIPHLQRMKDALNRGRTRTAKTPPAPVTPPPPTTPPGTTPPATPPSAPPVKGGAA